MGLLDRLERMTPREAWRFILTCLAVFWIVVAGAVAIPLLVG